MKTNKDKKATIKFFITLFVSTIFGGVIGWLIAASGEGLPNILVFISNWLQENSVLLLAVNLLFAVVSFCFYLQGKRFAIVALSSGDNEEAFDKADCQYSISLCLCSVCLILSFIFYGFSLNTIKTWSGDALFKNALSPVALFILTITLTIILQYIVVSATKRLYPEKRGNILDTKFQKDWYASCDEAERKLIGDAAYKSYSATGIIMPFLLLAYILLGLIVNIGVAPFIAIGIIWLTLNLSFCIAAMASQKKSKNR